MYIRESINAVTHCLSHTADLFMLLADSGILPKWTLFSSYDSKTSGGIIYTTCLLLSTIFPLGAAVSKTIADRAKTLKARLLETKSAPKLFSTRALNMSVQCYGALRQHRDY